jgi:fumarate hydratase, class II
VSAQVVGNDAAVAFAGALGNFELNVMMPVMARNLLESIRILGAVSRVFDTKCIAGIEADAERCRFYAESSPAISAALNPYLGYDEVARVLKRAMAENKTLREVVLEEGLMDEDDVDRALDIVAMTKGGLL